MQKLHQLEKLLFSSHFHVEALFEIEYLFVCFLKVRIINVLKPLTVFRQTSKHQLLENFRCWAYVSGPPRHCPTPRFPLHGFIYAMKPSSRHFFSVGDSILYRCSYGYKLDSNPKVYCHVSGWSHTPKCLCEYDCKA